MTQNIDPPGRDGIVTPLIERTYAKRDLYDKLAYGVLPILVRTEIARLAPLLMPEPWATLRHLLRRSGATPNDMLVADQLLPTTIARSLPWPIRSSLLTMKA
jgi:hypothetical protein